MNRRRGEPAFLVKVIDRVLVMTINRPEARNAINADVATGIGEAIERLKNDGDLHVGVLTATGTVAFCAGGDLKERASGRSIDAIGHPDWGFAGFTRHYVQKPIIGAINGAALGGGTEIALACDLLVAAETAGFGLPEVTLGFLPGGGGVVRLPKQIPPKIAMELLLTGRSMSATKAHELGLVNRVVPGVELMDTTLEIAHLISSHSPLATQQAKNLVYATLDRPAEFSEDVWSISEAYLEPVRRSSAAEEGRKRFLEDRH